MEMAGIKIGDNLYYNSATTLFRYSSRSDRSDYERREYHRDTPSRDTGRRRSSRDEDFYSNARVKDKRTGEKLGQYLLIHFHDFKQLTV